MVVVSLLNTGDFCPKLQGMRNVSGVYLIKFAVKVGNHKHKAHYYLGYSKHILKRLLFHAEGRGASITNAARKLGPLQLVGYWPNTDRVFERKIKGFKNHKIFDPCNWSSQPRPTSLRGQMIIVQKNIDQLEN